MSRWNLSEQEWEALARMQLAMTEEQVFRNVTIILMAVVGRTKESSASESPCADVNVMTENAPTYRLC